MPPNIHPYEPGSDVSLNGTPQPEHFRSEAGVDLASEENAVTIRVLIADDQPRARRSLSTLLTALHWAAPGSSGMPMTSGTFPVEVVGEAVDGPQTVEQAWALHPDVVVLDLHRRPASAAEPRTDGVETIQAIKSRWPSIRIVVLTMYAAERASVLAAGADAFLLKGCPTRELLDAVMPVGAASPGQLASHSADRKNSTPP